MCEIESTINSRPLTFSSDDPRFFLFYFFKINLDPRDLDVLTPNDLLLLRTSIKSSPPPGIFVQEDLYARKRWRQMQYLAEVFWKRWSKEYLASLQPRQKWLTLEKNVQQGDVVLIVDSFTGTSPDRGKMFVFLPAKDN